MKKGLLFLLTSSLLVLTACGGNKAATVETEAPETVASPESAASAQEAALLAKLGDDWEYVVNPDGFSARLGKDKLLIIAEAKSSDLFAEGNDKFDVDIDQFATGYVVKITNVKTTKAYTFWLTAGESIQSVLDSEDFGKRLVGISDSTFDLNMNLWAAAGAVYHGRNLSQADLSEPIIQMVSRLEMTDEGTGNFTKIPFEDRECLGDHIALLWDINSIDRKTISSIGKEMEYYEDDYEDDDYYSGSSSSGGYYYFDPIYGYVWIEEEDEDETETETEEETESSEIEPEEVRHDHYMVYTPKKRVDVYWWVTADHSVRREADDVNNLYYVETLGISFKHKLTKENAFDLTEDTITIYREHVGKDIQELYEKNIEEFY